MASDFATSAAIIAARNSVNSQSRKPQGSHSGQVEDAKKGPLPRQANGLPTGLHSHQAASIAHRGDSQSHVNRTQHGIVPKENLPPTTLEAASARQAQRVLARQSEHQARNQNKPAKIINIAPEYLTEHPPLRFEREERAHQQALHESAVSLAKDVYATRTAATQAARLAASQPDTDDFHASAQHQAASRLAKLNDPTERAHFQSYYGRPKATADQPTTPAAPARSKSQRLFRRNHPSLPFQSTRRHSINTVTTDGGDEQRSAQIKGKTSLFKSQADHLDSSPAASTNLLEVARQRVQQRMNEMDDKVFHSHGKMSPAMVAEWDEYTRRKQIENGERPVSKSSLVNMSGSPWNDNGTKQRLGGQKENQTERAVNVGGGRLVDSAEIEKLAESRVKPELAKMDEMVSLRKKAELEAEEKENERKQAIHEEKERRREAKAAEKAIIAAEQQKRQAEKDAENRRKKAEREAEKAKQRAIKEEEHKKKIEENQAREIQRKKEKDDADRIKREAKEAEVQRKREQREEEDRIKREKAQEELKLKQIREAAEKEEREKREAEEKRIKEARRIEEQQKEAEERALEEKRREEKEIEEKKRREEMELEEERRQAEREIEERKIKEDIAIMEMKKRQEKLAKEQRRREEKEAEKKKKVEKKQQKDQLRKEKQERKEQIKREEKQAALQRKQEEKDAEQQKKIEKEQRKDQLRREEKEHKEQIKSEEKQAALQRKQEEKDIKEVEHEQHLLAALELETQRKREYEAEEEKRRLQIEQESTGLEQQKKVSLEQMQTAKQREPSPIETKHEETDEKSLDGSDQAEEKHKHKPFAKLRSALSIKHKRTDSTRRNKLHKRHMPENKAQAEPEPASDKPLPTAVAPFLPHPNQDRFYSHTDLYQVSDNDEEVFVDAPERSSSVEPSPQEKTSNESNDAWKKTDKYEEHRVDKLEGKHLDTRFREEL